MTTGGTLNHSEQKHAQKTEPSFEPGPAAPPDLPARRAQPAAAEGALQRWGRRVVFLGLALLAMAAAGGLTYLGLDLYETYGAKDVVAADTPAQAPSGALLLPERRSADLPPLVLLPQDAKTAPAKDAPPAVAVAAVPAPLIVVPPAPAPKPLAVKAKPVKLAAQAVAKPRPVAVVKKPVVALKKPVLAVKKPVVPVKRAPAPAPAKVVAARAKPVKAAVPAPPRSQGRDPAFDDPPAAAAADRRCRPGELARECEERTR